jgi:iron(III) transport system substrate-binding protein
MLSCGDGSEEVVNIYTHRHYDTDQELFAKFTEATGIKVNVVNATADELIQKLEMEGANSPADLLITVDAGRLVRAEEKGLFQPIQSDIINQNIPAKFRDPEGYWTGLTYRARIIAFSKERVKPEDLSTYEDLVTEKWKGRILTRSSENIYNQSLLASIIAANGVEEAEKWAAGVLANMAREPKGSDRDQVKAVASGEGDLAIVNTYYIGLMLNDENPEETKAAEQVGIFFPNQEGRGTHINISGVGLTKHAPNKANAIKLIEYLSEEEAQSLLANLNYEFPINPRVELSPLLQSWGNFKGDEINLSVLGENNPEAVMIFDRIGWK